MSPTVALLAPVAAPVAVPVSVPAQAAPAAAPASEAGRPEVLSGYLTGQTVKTALVADSKEPAIHEMARMPATTGNGRGWCS
ncbi:hypothetical protein ACFXB3_40970 [Streptomyces sp. NPDC059447]|uniref:hypothetical protein n=1 Tax=Streptomyces sp. NPDC059447 TaxID=3346834 RepID=UPI0036C5F440